MRPGPLTTTLLCALVHLGSHPPSPPHLPQHLSLLITHLPRSGRGRQLSCCYHTRRMRQVSHSDPALAQGPHTHPLKDVQRGPSAHTRATLSLPGSITLHHPAAHSSSHHPGLAQLDPTLGPRLHTAPGQPGLPRRRQWLPDPLSADACLGACLRAAPSLAAAGWIRCSTSIDLSSPATGNNFTLRSSITPALACTHAPPSPLGAPPSHALAASAAAP